MAGHAVLPAPEPVFEPGPFPIRIQTAADLEAARFDLLAWQDPWAEDGPASAFWVRCAGSARYRAGAR